MLAALLASIAIFALLRQLPGNPAYVLAGSSATPAQVAALAKVMGLDRPLPVQYLDWLWQVVRGNLGTSIFTGQPVTHMLGSAFMATLQLAAASLVIMVVVGFALGVSAAWWRGSWIDSVATMISSITLGVPIFWVGALLLHVFALNLRWLPAGGWINILQQPWAGLRSLILPSAVVGLVQAGILSRFVRTSVISSLEQDYARAARARGLRGSRIAWQYGVRPALISIVTVMGLLLGTMLSGVIIVEAVFTWPGLGTLLVTAVGNRDYPLIEGTLLLLIATFALVNVGVDILYLYLDPRTRR